MEIFEFLSYFIILYVGDFGLGFFFRKYFVDFDLCLFIVF